MEVKVEGVEELTKKLEELASEVGPRKTTYILSDAARIVKNAIKKFAPKGPTGNLRRSIYSAPLPIKDFYPAAAKVRVNYWIGPHAHLVEKGTKPRFQKSGRYTGVMPAKPFFFPGWQSVEGNVRTYIMIRLMKAIERAAR